MARALSLAGPALAAVLALPGAASAQVEGWPARLDFGLSAPDCPGVQALIGLRNAGEAPLVIEEARFEGAGFLALEPAPDFPLTVAPMGRVSFGIRLVSPLDGPWSAELVLETSEGPLTSRLGGTVVSERIDRFVTTPHPKTDALVVIDDAASMREVQAGLRATLEEVFTELVAQGPDWQVGVITPSAREGGRLRALPSGERFVSILEPDAVERLLALSDVGYAGPGDRLGLWAVREALTSRAEAENAGFLRPDAALEILVVSDADDLSPGTVDEYREAFRALRGGCFADVTFSWVGSGATTGCSGPFGQALPGLRYLALATSSGNVESLCTADWVNVFEQPAWEFRRHYTLSAEPVHESLEVTMAGGRLPADDPRGTVNWTYDDASQVLVFSPFVAPGWDEAFEVRYRPRACRVVGR